MKKRYIDFVPAKGKKAPNGAKSRVRTIKVSTVSEPKKSAPRSVPKSAPKPVSKPAPKKLEKKSPVNPLMDELEVEEIFAEREEPAGVSKGRKGSRYGVVEDYQPRFVRSDVKKRPLGQKEKKESDKADKTSEVPIAKISAKSTKVKPAAKFSSAKTAVKAVPKSTPKPTMGMAAGAAAGVTARPLAKRPMGPRANFVNTNKIEKRPLSKSAYVRKPVVLPDEKPTKPVKIIEKPEKDSKAGLIIAIILTIILGAAAGTVAFLLLPK